MLHFADLSRTAFRAGICCALLLSIGCAGRRVSPFAGLDLQQARALAQKLEKTRDAELQADLQSAFATHAPRNILILSGGDADGAFGCGVLCGWREASGGRPVFDVVTGVSTGALMATFVFLAQAQDDALLRDVYTHLHDKDVMGGLFAPAPPDSVFDTSPLRRLIARYVTADALRRVAAAHREGRRLYVATVELDSGALVIWPLSKIAADAIAPPTPSTPGDTSNPNKTSVVNPAGLERFRQILLAAASIPVVFPPVEIDGGLHVDAGLRETVFVRQAMLGVGRAYGAACDVGVTSPPSIYAIVNGKLRSNPEPTGDDLLHIGVRSLAIYTDALQVFNLRDAAHLAAAHDPPFRFRWLAEPDELESSPGPGLFQPMFDPANMTRLFQAGQAITRQPSAFWNEGPPRLDGEMEQ